MRGGQENKKAADGGERATARRSPGTAKGSSWHAPRAGFSRVFFLPQQSDGKAAISVHHRQPATARPVDHRLTLDPCGLAYSLLRPPASTPKVVAARGWTTGLPPQAIATRQGRDWAAGPTIAVPRRLARDETDSAGKAAKEGQGSRLGAQAGAAGRSLERGPSGREVQGDSPRPNEQREAADCHL